MIHESEEGSNAQQSIDRQDSSHNDDCSTGNVGNINDIDMTIVSTEGDHQDGNSVLAHNEMKLGCESPNHSQSTQNIELTQLYDFDEYSQQSFSQSSNHGGTPSSILPKNPLTIPWARLSSTSTHFDSMGRIANSNVHLLPRSPSNSTSTHTSSSPPLSSRLQQGNNSHSKAVHFLGLTLNPSDIFNEHTIGRSEKCDLVATKRPINIIQDKDKNDNKYDSEANNDDRIKTLKREKLKIQKFVHGLISNSHCRIFCIMKHDPTSTTLTASIASNTSATTTTKTRTSLSNAVSPSTPSNSNNVEMEVYIEDTSGNGTYINNHTLLKRNERRLLHTGDVICLLNPKIIHKKVRNPLDVKDILNHYSFVFVNLFKTCGSSVAGFGTGFGVSHNYRFGGNGNENGHRHDSDRIRQRLGDDFLLDGNNSPSTAITNTNASNMIGKGDTGAEKGKGAKRKRGLVNVRAMNNHHKHVPIFKQIAAAIVGGAKEDRKSQHAHCQDPSEHLTMPPPNKRPCQESVQDRTQNHHGHNLNASNKIAATASTAKKQETQQKEQQPNYKHVEEEYDMRDEIGSGTCGQVRRAIHRRTGQMVAIKIITLGNTPGSMNRIIRLASLSGDSDSVLSPSDKHKDNFERKRIREEENDMKMVNKIIQDEASILQSLDHPYIVKLLDVFIHPKKKAVYLVMELVHGGDLFDRIIQKGKYSEIESRRVMRRLLAAIYHLHEELDIVHRDLKPENILCVSRYDDINVKLTDFGLAKSITEDGLKTFCGTPQYFAPEVLRRRNSVTGRGRYDKKADMWSLGVILYILLSGTPPFDVSGGIDTIEEESITFRSRKWSSISKGAKDLVKSLLRTDPTKRVSVVDACHHEWMLTEDGDTHIHPLKDPAVKTTCVESQMNGRSTDHVVQEVLSPQECGNNQEKQLIESSHQPAPQSILQSPSPEMNIREIVNGNLSPPHKSDSILKPIVLDGLMGEIKHLDRPAQGESEESPRQEALTPNQAAHFPALKENEVDGIKLDEDDSCRSTQLTENRESLFSFVKQLSNDNRNGSPHLDINGSNKCENPVSSSALRSNQTNDFFNSVKTTTAKNIATDLDKKEIFDNSGTKVSGLNGKQATLSRWFEKK